MTVTSTPLTTTTQSGAYPAKQTLQDVVKQVMESRGWSLRAAENATGLQFNSVDRMVKGIPVETDTIIKFAIAAAPQGKEIETVIEWLYLGGRTMVAQIMERAIHPPVDGVPQEYQELIAAWLSSDRPHRTLAMQVLHTGSESSTSKVIKN